MMRHNAFSGIGVDGTVACRISPDVNRSNEFSSARRVVARHVFRNAKSLPKRGSTGSIKATGALGGILKPFGIGGRRVAVGAAEGPTALKT